jgi:type II secretory pathway pseudopilin PulG
MIGTEKRDRHAKKRGSVLLTALVISLILMASAAALVTTSLYRQSAARARIESTRAEQVAETGLDIAFYEVQSNSDVTNDAIGVATGTSSGGSYTATIAPAFAGPGTYTLTSVGRYGTRTQTVERVISKSASSTPGFLGVDKVTLAGGASVDSFDSYLGTYASQVSGGHAASDASLGSNGNIATFGAGKVWGDANPGPSGVYSGSVTVSGSTAPASKSVTVPAYVYSPPGMAMSAWNGGGSLAAGTYHFTSVTVSGGPVLMLSGDVTIYCDNNFTVTAGSSIVMAPGSNVTILQGASDMTIGGGGISNLNSKASTLTIHSASTTKVHLASATPFYGTVSAPGADFTSSGSGGMYGSVVAKTIILNSATGWLHYDTSLETSTVGGFEVQMVRGW